MQKMTFKRFEDFQQFFPEFAPIVDFGQPFDLAENFGSFLEYLSRKNFYAAGLHPQQSRLNLQSFRLFFE